MLSIIVIAKNEEEMIKACLESVKWADEVVVVDNGSTDDTLKIAKKFTDNVFEFKEFDFAALRNFAMSKVSGDWVLYVDADERVLNPLKEEMLEIIKNTKNSAFALSRKNIIFGAEVSYGPYKKDWVIRLFKKTDFETWVGRVHEYGKFKGELGYSKNSLLHLTHRNLDQVILKSLSWSHIDANLRLEVNHPPMSGWRFLRILFGEFFYQGVVRRGFFAGTIGTIDSILQTFSLFMTYVRLWQLQQKQSLEKTYQEIDERLIKNGFNY